MLLVAALQNCTITAFSKLNENILKKLGSGSKVTVHRDFVAIRHTPPKSQVPQFIEPAYVDDAQDFKSWVV